MTRSPMCCTPGTAIETVAALMLECNCGAIPVVGDLATRTPLGIVTDRDIVVRTIAKGRDPMGLTARDCMTTPAVTVLDEMRLHGCVRLLELNQIRRAIVVDSSGGCVGIVSQADIARSASKRETGDLVREVSKPPPASVS